MIDLTKVLTIIIPSYNTSAFIDTCLPTFLDDRFIDDIEVIIVDDGSTDDTAVKAQIFVDKYPNSVFLISKENGGHGSGINVGIKQASGKYFKIVDGDDYINPSEMSHFIDQLKNNDSDLFISYFTTVSDITGKINVISPYDFRLIEKKDTVELNKVLPVNEVLEHVYGSIHSVTFRTDILTKHNIQMTENTFYEDNEFVLYPIAYVKTVFVSECNVYVYRIDQVNQSISKANTQKRVGELKKIIQNLVRYYISLPVDTPETQRKYILRGIANQIYIVFGVYISFSEDKREKKAELMQFDREVKEMSAEVYHYAGRYKLVRAVRMFHYLFYVILAGRKSGKGGKSNKRY